MLAVLDRLTPLAAEISLQQLGFSTLRLPPHPRLPATIASHPDLLLFFAPDAVFCTESYSAIAAEALSVISNACRKPICTVKSELGDRYPQDVLFNAAPLGRFLICRPNSLASEILASSNLQVLSVRQGYTKCSLVPVGNRALITADVGIAEVAERAGLDVLRLASLNVRLDGYSCGFIGGATGFAPYGGTDLIPFCGALTACEASAQMKSFCKAHGYTLQSLGNFEPTDVGTIFLL